MKTPVVLIIYHRPELVNKLIENLRFVKPKKIYVIADGPKNMEDKIACESTRAVIDTIDWPCEVKKIYSKDNLGLRRRVVSGLNEVFSIEDRAIILEDDLVPDPSFFKFCDELLEKYENDERIISISGNNFQFDKNKIKESYYFSKYVHSWGWATWKRAWHLYDDNMESWKKLRKTNWLGKILDNYIATLYWRMIFDLVNTGKIDSWAYRWTYSAMLAKGLTIIPNRNLVSNVGVGESATHTKKNERKLNMPTHKIRFPLIHPKEVRINKKCDKTTEKNVYLTTRIALGLIIRYTWSVISGKGRANE